MSLLKAKEVGVETALVPTFLVLMSVVYGLTAYPCGILADHMNRRLQLGIGVMVLLCGDIVLATAGTIWMTAIGTGLWGFQMGIIQGLLAASVADAAPERIRGTAFGIYYLADGAASLLASSGAGVLWMIGGSGLTFSIGASLAAAVALMLLLGPLPRAPGGSS